jgi:neutral ceramidase
MLFIICYLICRSGRRVREAIAKEFTDNGQNVKVVLSGLANTYSNYVATYEEYQLQRYEAGSTMYGPHTLQAYIQQFRYLANNMIKKQKITSGDQFPNLLKKEITFKPGVVLDAAAVPHKFGDVTHDVKPVYSPGNEVKVVFISADPRNNLQLEGTYLTVERLDKNSSNWEVIATDANWETK